MMKKILHTRVAAACLLAANVATAEEHLHDHGDDPVVAKVMVDQLELHHADDTDLWVVDAQAWIGKDLNKFWLKTDIEKRHGDTEHAELQALYSRAIAPYWDVQLGLRQDLQPAPSQDWAVLGLHGLAPYFFEVDAALFVGDGGKTALRLSADYDLHISQTIILSPALTANIYGQDERARGTEAGFVALNAGLRLRYEIVRECAPYVGLNWQRTAPHTTSTALVAGLRLWF